MRLLRCAALFALVAALPLAAHAAQTADDMALSHLRGSAPQAELNTSAACGITINATMNTGSDCGTQAACLNSISTTGLGRIFRDGVAAGCDPAKPCPGTFATTTTYLYDLFDFNFDDEAGDDCFCLDVDFNTGTCGFNVHGATYAGLYAIQPANLACTGTGRDNNPFEYIGDVGSSLTQPFSGPFTKVVATGDPNVANTSFIAHTNFSGGTGCSYSFTLDCGAAESLQCLVLPPLELIEEKLDEFECNEGGGSGSLAVIPRTR